MRDLSKRILKTILTFILLALRIFQIEIMIFYRRISSRHSKEIYLFNVDFHTSIIADIETGLKDFKVNLTSWCISGNNRNFRRFFKIPDPVFGLSGKNWLQIGDDDFRQFKKRYKRYLETFDGFVVCFPPAFIELYIELKKPILVVIGTRYEAPYTDREINWTRLDHMLKDGVHNGQIMIAANNLADKDYLEYFTSISAEYVPSLCDYTKQNWRLDSSLRIVLSKNVLLFSRLRDESGLDWKSPTEAFGSNFKWSRLHTVSEIFVLPYNISTMTLFELATSGVPVSVPSPKLLKTLIEKDPGIMSELSFYQVRKMSSSNLRQDNPNRTDKDAIIDWWLERADFYNPELMPNVRVVSDFSELGAIHPWIESFRNGSAGKVLAGRNTKLYAQRQSLLEEFLQKVLSSKDRLSCDN